MRRSHRTIPSAYLWALLIVILAVLFSAGCGTTSSDGGQDRVEITLSASSINFGDVTVGTSSTQRIDVRNTGTINIAINSVTVSGNFTQTNTCGAQLVASASCSISLVFAPAVAGSATGTLAVSDSAPGSPHQVSLTGNGTGGGAPPPEGGPALLFSDLDWGPNSGWEGSSTRGAAVTVWGKNFGSTRGSSYVTVNGAQLTADSDYAEWGAIGPARGLQRITFWVPSRAQSGSGTISVTVNGVTSATVTFLVTSGTIYFISPSGSDTNNGLYSTQGSGTNGPFRNIYKFNPGLDAMHTAGTRNPSGDGQYIVYVRAGTYTTLDVDSAFLALRGPYGGPAKRKALIGYPGEVAILNSTNATRGIVWVADYDPYGFVDYVTYAKLTGTGGVFATGVFGSYTRVIGCTLKDYLAPIQAGVVMVADSKYTSVLGNLFQNNGYDSFKHNVYIKTQLAISGADLSTLYTYVGWNEFSNAVASDAHGGVVFVSRASNVPTYYTNYVYIHDNYFHDGSMDFVYVGDNIALGDVYIYNNIFKAGSSLNGGLTFYAGTNNAYVYNNTFYQIGPASAAMIWATGTARLQFKNNVWYSSPGQPFFKLESWQGATANFDHDLFFNPSGSTSPPSGTGITLLSPVISNPLFVNVSANDFRVQVGSAAINAGVNTVRPTVVQDYDGQVRPQGAAYDIGAYEQ